MRSLELLRGWYSFVIMDMESEVPTNYEVVLRFEELQKKEPETADEKKSIATEELVSHSVQPRRIANQVRSTGAFAYTISARSWREVFSRLSILEAGN